MNHNAPLPRACRSVLLTAGLCLVTCPVLLGCAVSAPPPRAQFTGTVSEPGGKMVSGGTIRLDFGAQGIATAPIDPRGSFVFRNLPVGDARIAVETRSAKQGKQPPRFAQVPEEAAKALKAYDAMVANSTGAKDRAAYMPIAPKYAEFDKSGLTIHLNAGKNHKNIIVEKE